MSSRLRAMDRGISIVYGLTDEADERAIRSAVDQLSPAERQHHDRLVPARSRRDFALAHAMLRRVLSSREARPPSEWTFDTNAYGKPCLVTSGSTAGLAFNLSHCDGLVACVVAVDAEVGIDVEAIDRMRDAGTLASRFFSPVEADAIRQCRDDEARRTRFVELWTLKEAYVKARGRGLSMPLDEFAFVLDAPGALRLLHPNHDAAAWRVVLFAPTIRHRMAVVVENRTGEPHRLAARLDSTPHPESCGELLPVRQSFAGTVHR